MSDSVLETAKTNLPDLSTNTITKSIEQMPIVEQANKLHIATAAELKEHLNSLGFKVDTSKLDIGKGFDVAVEDLKKLGESLNLGQSHEQMSKLRKFVGEKLSIQGETGEALNKLGAAAKDKVEQAKQSEAVKTINEQVAKIGKSDAVQNVKAQASELIETAKSIGGPAGLVIMLNEKAAKMEAAGGFMAFLAIFLRMFSSIISIAVPNADLESAKKKAENAVASAKDEVVVNIDKNREKTWSNMLLLNTKYATFFDASKKLDFDNAWKDYINEAKSSGENMFFSKEDFDIQKLFSSEGKAAKNFVNALKEKKVYLAEFSPEIIKEKLWESLKASGWISQAEAQVKKEKFYKMMEDKKYDAFVQPLQAIKENKEWNLATAMGNSASLGATFLFDLNRAGVIPLDAIGAYIKDGVVVLGLATTKFLMNRSVNDFVYTVSGKRFEDIAAMKPEDKKVMMSILYHQMIPQLYMTGLAAKLIASVGLMSFYWEQGTGITSMKWSFENMLGQYENMSKTLESLADDTLPKNQVTEIREFDMTVRQYLSEKIVQMRLVALYRKNPNASTAEFIVALQKDPIFEAKNNPKIELQQKAYVESVVKVLQESSPNTWLSNVLQEILSKKIGGLDKGIKTSWNGKALWEIKSFWSGADQQSSVLFDLDSTSASLGKALSRAVAEKWSLGDGMLALWRVCGYGSPTEFIEAVNKGQIILNVKSPDEAVKVMQNVIKEIPPGLHTLFFKTIPVGIAIHDASMSEQKLSTLATDLASINPLYASFFLFVEWWNMKGTTIVHPGYFIAGATAFGLTAIELRSIVMSSRPLMNGGKFLASPIFAVTDTIGMVARFGQNTARFIRAGSTTSILEAGLAKTAGTVARSKVRSGLAALGITAAIVGPSVAFAYVDQKQLTETLGIAERKGLYNPETGLLWSGIKEGWSTWTEEQKKSLVRMSCLQMLGAEMVDYDPKNGKVKVMINAPRKKPEVTQVGIVTVGEIEAWRKTVSGFGLTPEVAYTRSADTYLTEQFSEFEKSGLSQEAITEFKQKLYWTEGSEAALASKAKSSETKITEAKQVDKKAA